MSRTLFLSVVLVLSLLALAVKSAVALDVPALTGRVVDRADILVPEAEARISARLEAYERASGQQFAVLTVESLEGDSLEDYSIRVVEHWKLGKKGKDDGLLLLVVSGEKKVRIEVGYGLEGDITDALSSRIIRDVITPAFRGGDFAGGIDAALTALMQAAAPNASEVPGPVEPTNGRQQQPRGIPFSTILWMLLMILPFILPPFFGGRRRRGLGGLFIGGMGGGSRGGGFGGGGFGGGGFSGGGGGFGGGGASGRW